MLAYSLAAFLALQALGAVPKAGPQYVKSCDPCTIVLHDGTPPANFLFDVQTVPQGRVVRAILFERPGHNVQRLEVPSMAPLAPGDLFFFGGQDINFDGWLDLLFMTERGSANASAQYWIYDPSAGRFRALGEFPIFRVDAVHKRLSTYITNGPASLDFEKRDYEFQRAALILLDEETQKPSRTRPGWYIHTVRRRKNGKLALVQRQSIKPPPP